MGKKKEKEELQEASSPAWMTTYGDMMTLLLCFFVLMISFANVDDVKFEPVLYALQGSLGVMPHKEKPIPTTNPTEAQSMKSKMNVYQDVMEDMVKMAEELGMMEEISVSKTEGGMLIRLGSKVLFDLGNAEIKKESYPLLDLVGRAIAENAHEVNIVGHTDNLPIKSASFKSNWELSTTRAMAVVDYLIKKCNVPPEKLIAAGRAEFDPLDTNDTAEGRQRNRRVEFLVSW